MLPLCFRSASTLLPPFAPQAARARAAARGRLRALRAGGRSRLRRRAASPQGHMNGRRPGRASASALPPPPALPQRLRPSSTWRAVRVACLAPALMVAMVAPLYLPSISGAISTSSCKYGRATPTPRRRRSAALWRSSSSSPTRPICMWTETWQTRSSDAELPTLGFESRIRWGSNHGFSNRNVWEFVSCFPTTSPFSDETLPSARRRRTYVLAV